LGFLKRLFTRKRAGVAPPDDGGHRMTSLVLLSVSPVALDLETLRAALDAVFPGQFLPPREAGNLVVDGPVKGAMFMVMSAVPGFEGGFMVHTVPGPYDDFSPFRTHIRDPRVLGAVARHRAWMSVDRIVPMGTEEGHYRFIGRLLAHLAPPDAVALVHPSRMQTLEATPDVLRDLAGEGPVRWLEGRG